MNAQGRGGGYHRNLKRLQLVHCDRAKAYRLGHNSGRYSLLLGIKVRASLLRKHIIHTCVLVPNTSVFHISFISLWPETINRMSSSNFYRVPPPKKIGHFYFCNFAMSLVSVETDFSNLFTVTVRNDQGAYTRNRNNHLTLTASPHYRVNVREGEVLQKLALFYLIFS